MYPSTLVGDGDGAMFLSDRPPRAGYRREFEEMENRIRKCERQRADLERQFAELMRERAECERTAVRAMKQRQKRIQEAERQRAERNESILRMLNKIDQQAVSLAAKTDRLKMLKTQYEMYLMRTWSTPALTYPVYNPPMVTASPAMATPLPHGQPSSKSEFVQYLSDLTHQQTASVNPIPPPMALSNYLAAQQKPYVQPVSSYTTNHERSFSRMMNDCGAPLEQHTARDGSSHLLVGGTSAKKFEMSNEDFIRYIDSEVLKEPMPTISVVAPSSEGNKGKASSGAYLEDGGLSEEDPVVDLSNKLDTLSILQEEENKQTVPNESTKDQSHEHDALQPDPVHETEIDKQHAVENAKHQSLQKAKDKVEEDDADIKQTERVVVDETVAKQLETLVQKVNVSPVAMIAEENAQSDPAREHSTQLYETEHQPHLSDEYQAAHYQPAQHNDGQQSTDYQYVESDGQQAGYQSEQFLEGGVIPEQAQYQYPEGVDQTSNAYQQQDSYLGQQYQYDGSTPYYGEQQGYEGQYYGEESQQQQQQYYTEETHDQQQPQQEQQHDLRGDQTVEQMQEVRQTVDYYADHPNEQNYYPAPDEQYKTAVQHPVPPEPIAIADESVAAPSKATSDVPAGDISGVSDSNALKEKQEKPPIADADPGSDVPTLSTVNDESDFDFSTHVMFWLVLCSLNLVIIIPAVRANDRLLNATIPLHYDLHLEAKGFGRDDYTYRGNVSIRIAIVHDTDQVVLHNVGSTLNRIQLMRYADRETIPHWIQDTDSRANEQLHIRTNRTLSKLNDAELLLTITFNNTLREERKGFFVALKFNPERMPLPVATTHFQPCYARLAFPCFDEPALKTTFQITIVSGADLLVASNTPIEKITPLPGDLKEVLFERTAPMPTYLVSFLIANYTGVHTKSPSGVQIGILAAPEDQEQMKFSLNATSTLLTSLEQYTEQNLGLAKLDLVAIPHLPNALESWGLFTLDEQLLMLTEMDRPQAERVPSLLTISHEIAHQLFGNLVGPVWWSYLWLSEGFAAYFEIVLGNKAYPDLVPLEESYIQGHTRRALLEDVKATHPLTMDDLSGDPVHLETIFNTITYSKAATIIRMVNCSIGEVAFKRGVSQYLSTHRYGAVQPEDLYSSFSDELERITPDQPTVEQIFRSWADKPGYPLVSVERLNASFVRLQQKRLQRQPALPDVHSRWFIPITYRTNSSGAKFEYQPAFWMKESDQQLVVQLEMTQEDVLIVNPRQIGFYRVQYDESGWRNIMTNFYSLPALVQTVLLDNALELVRVGHLELEMFQELRQLANISQSESGSDSIASRSIQYLRMAVFSEHRLAIGFVEEFFGIIRKLRLSHFRLQGIEQVTELLTQTIRSILLRQVGTDADSPPMRCQATVDELVSELRTLNASELEPWMDRFNCQIKRSNEDVLPAFKQILQDKTLTGVPLYEVMLKLMHADSKRFLEPVVQILSTENPDATASENLARQRLLSRLVRKVTDRVQAGVLQNLLVINSSILPGNFQEQANFMMTSAITWRTVYVPKLSRLINELMYWSVKANTLE
ncbi:uncharacterized protein LOC128721955 [Anopheles nili]|uniref:uncharacterized protein LOC128721955 n=1 Tax=Anopheles nili TaxID=185578 RepID=UPI00237BAB65|nr:uncharacterized protein LOC128721955 [Anopheles nili]